MASVKTYRLKKAVPQSHDVADILFAMQRGLAISFNYDGKRRVVEPHALGISNTDGGVLLRAYQVAGDSSRPLPQWVMFKLAKVTGLTPTFIESHAPRDGYKMNDQSMGDMIAELAV